MNIQSENKFSIRWIILFLTVLLLTFAVYKSVKNSADKQNNHNSFLKELPSEYIALLKNTKATDDRFQYGFLEDSGIRELVIFKKSPNDNNLIKEFKVEINTLNNVNNQVTTLFNIKKEAIIYNYDRTKYAVYKLALPIINIESITIRENPIKGKDKAWTSTVEKPFEILPQLEIDLDELNNAKNALNPNPYTFLFEKVLSQNETEFQSGSFKTRKDSLYIEYDLLKRYSNDSRRTIVKIENSNVFWNSINSFDKSLLKKIKIYGENSSEQHELLLSYLNGETPLDAIFDIEKLAVFHAIQKVFGKDCYGEPAVLYFNEKSMLFEPLYVSSKCLGSVGRKIEKPLIYDVDYLEMNMNALDKFSKRDFFKDIQMNRNAFKENLYLINSYYPNEVFNYDVIRANQGVIQKNLNPSIALKCELVSMGSTTMTVDIENLSSFPIEVLGLFTTKNKEITEQWESLELQNGTKETVRIDLPRSFENLFVSKKKKVTGFILPKHIYDLVIRFTILGLDTPQNAPIVPYQKEELENEDIFRSEVYVNNHKDLVVNEEKKEVLFSKDSILVSAPLVIPNGYTFKIEAGTQIDIVEGGKIISNAPLQFLGTMDRPIRISSSDSRGQGLIVFSEGKRSILKHVIFDQLRNPKHGSWSVTGAITFYESPVHLNYVHVKNNHCEDALNIVRTDFYMNNVTISNTQSDAFDGDFVSGTISNSTFDYLGNDAIDVSGSDLIIKNVVISNAGDKGLSAGENSKMTVDNVDISTSEIAVAGKDLSIVEAKNLNIFNTKLGFTAFQKKPEFGPSQITVNKVIMEGVETKYLIESSSTLIVDGEKIETTQNVKDRMYGVEFGISSDETRNTPN